jgi:tetratricopeptide (TPR) repeat protein
MDSLTWKGGFLAFIGLIAAALLIGGCAPGARVPIPTLGTPEHHTYSGMRLLKQGKLMDAEREFEVAIELDRTYASAYRGLAIVLGYKGDFKTAFQYMAKAEELAKGKQEKALAYVGFMRLHTQQKGEWWLAQVESYFREAMKTLRDLPEMPDPYYYMGLAYKEAFRFSDAGGAFKKVLEINKTLMREADQQLSTVQKIARAMPATPIGKRIALLDKVKRIDVAALFIRELKLDKVYEDLRSQRISDVPIPPDVKDHPLRTDVQRVINLGIKGLDTFPNGTFAPDEYILRAGYAMMIADIISTLTNDPSMANAYQNSMSPFADVRNDVPYFNAVMVCTTRGIIQAKGGMKQSIFGPMDSVSGSEAVLAIRRLKEYLRLF